MITVGTTGYYVFLVWCSRVDRVCIIWDRVCIFAVPCTQRSHKHMGVLTPGRKYVSNLRHNSISDVLRLVQSLFSIPLSKLLVKFIYLPSTFWHITELIRSTVHAYKSYAVARQDTEDYSGRICDTCSQTHCEEGGEGACFPSYNQIQFP